jgi:hypothetical protein
MDPHSFDRLTRTLFTVGSRRAVACALLATAGATLGLASAHDAEASATKKCRRKGGLRADKGTCHCGWQCSADIVQFTCHDNPNCVCYKDASGRGFCGEGSGNNFCTKNSDCDPDRTCALHTCAGGLCILPCST